MTGLIDGTIAGVFAAADALHGGNGMEGGDNPVLIDANMTGEIPSVYHHPVAVALRGADESTAARINNGAIRDFLRFSGLLPDLDNVIRFGEGLTARSDSQALQMRGHFLVSQTKALQAATQLALAKRGIFETRRPSFSDLTLTACLATPARYDVRPDWLRIDALVTSLGFPGTEENLPQRLMAWRNQNLVNPTFFEAEAEGTQADLNVLFQANLLPHLPTVFHSMNLGRMDLKIVTGVSYSGNLMYQGKESDLAGRPLGDAICEINGDLAISRPELTALIAHERMHVLQFALIHGLYLMQHPGFGIESTLPTMCSPGNTLNEGMADNALLIANGVQRPSDLSPELELAYLLMNLQEKAKAMIASAIEETLQDGPTVDIPRLATWAADLYLLTTERAAKLIKWAMDDLQRGMYLPSYAEGSRIVKNAIASTDPKILYPFLFGVHGPVAIGSISQFLRR